MVKQIEPFGYFRALPFGWEDCSDEDEGAIALYEQSVIDSLLLENDTYKKHSEKLNEMLWKLSSSLGDVTSKDDGAFVEIDLLIERVCAILDSVKSKGEQL